MDDLPTVKEQILSAIYNLGRQPEYEVNFTKWQMHGNFDGDLVPLSVSPGVAKVLEAELKAQGYEVISWNETLTTYSHSDRSLAINTGVKFRPIRGK